MQKLLKEPLGLTTPSPFSGESGARYVERTGQGLNESIQYIRLLLGQLGILSGVPDYVFGVQLGRPQNETERVLFAGQSRVNAFRSAMSAALGQFGLSVDFGTEPFITRKECVDNLIKQLQAGGLSVSEVRTIMGYN